MSKVDTFKAFRPPPYYKIAKQLQPPQLPDEFESIHTVGLRRCEPHGSVQSLLTDPDAILVNKFTHNLNVHISDQLVRQRIASIPHAADDIKALVKEQAADYIAQLCVALDQFVYGEQAALELAKQREQLAFTLDVLKHRQATVLIKRELENRITKKKQMITGLRQMRENARQGKEVMSLVKLPK